MLIPFFLYGLLTVSCTALKSLNEAHLYVGDDWTEGSIAVGSHFTTGISSGGRGEGIDIESSDTSIFKPDDHDDGRTVLMTAMQEGSADILAVNKDDEVLDSLTFSAVTAADLQLVDHQRQVISSPIVGLVDTDLYVSPDLLDANGNSLWHSLLVETTDYDRDVLYTSTEGAYLKLMLDYTGEQEFGIQTPELSRDYSIQIIEVSDLVSFSFEQGASQDDHPDENVYNPADYQYTWVEIVVNATNAEDLPVLIPSTDLYVSNAQSTWAPEAAINYLWALIPEDELPILSLTPPDSSSDGSDLEIPEHNQ